MPIYLGENLLDFPDLKLGDTLVQKVYYNSIIVYPVISSGTPLPPETNKE
jgi:hypothetical protein